MAKTVSLKAGKTVVIYRRNFSSLATKIHFDAVAVDGGWPQGQVAVRGSNWIFPKSPELQPLKTMNTVSAGYWDTFFAIAVTADTNLTITLPSHQLAFPVLWLWGIIAAVGSIAAAITFLLS